MFYIKNRALLIPFIFLSFLLNIKFCLGLIVNRPLVNNSYKVSVKVCNRTDLTLCLKISDDVSFAPVYMKIKNHTDKVVDILIPQGANVSIIVSMLKNYGDNPLLHGIEMEDLKISDFLKENQLLNIDKQNCLRLICDRQETGLENLGLDKLPDNQKTSDLEIDSDKVTEHEDKLPNNQKILSTISQDFNKTGQTSKIIYKLEKEHIFSDQELKEYNNLVYETIYQLGGAIPNLFRNLYSHINSSSNSIFSPIRENQINQIKFIYRALSGALIYYEIYHEPLRFSFLTRDKKIELIKNLICFLFALSLSKKQYFTKGVVVIDDPGRELEEFLKLTAGVKISPIDYFHDYIESQADFDFEEKQWYLEIYSENRYINQRGYGISFGLLKKKKELNPAQIFIAFDDPLNLVKIDTNLYNNYLLTDEIPRNIFDEYKIIMKDILADQDFITDLNHAATYGISLMIKKLLQTQIGINKAFQNKILCLVKYISDNYDNLSQRIGKEVILRKDSELKIFFDNSEIDLENLENAIQDINSDIIEKIGL